MVIFTTLVRRGEELVFGKDESPAQIVENVARYLRLRESLAAEDIKISHQESIQRYREVPLYKRDAAQTSLSAFARRHREMRDKAKAILPLASIGDPSLDILLDVFIAGEERWNLSVSAASIVGGTPATTGLRHITALERAGMIERSVDPFDKRRDHLHLSAETHQQMAEWLQGFLAPDQKAQSYSSNG